MYARLAVAIGIEFLYAVFTRTSLRIQFSGVELELWVTACRVVALAVYWLLFRKLLSEAQADTAPRPTILLAGGIASICMVPLLFYGGYPTDRLFRLVFALTSIVVAAKEELLYRGVIQILLARRFGFASAVVMLTLNSVCKTS